MRAKSAGLLLLLGLMAPVTGCGTENETNQPVEQNEEAGGEAGTTVSPAPTEAGGEGGEGGEDGEAETTTSPAPTEAGGEGGEGGEG